LSEATAASGSTRKGARRGESRADMARPPAALRLLNVGYGNLVLASRVVAIVSSASAPMRRLREESDGRGKLVDATQGRRTRSILVTDSDHVILSALNPETIAARLAEEDAGLREP
jgi:regulator of extracellular matrix RemA (YlzA/DUF370 family)